jgi:hypothetical protein
MFPWFPLTGIALAEQRHSRGRADMHFNFFPLNPKKNLKKRFISLNLEKSIVGKNPLKKSRKKYSNIQQ